MIPLTNRCLTDLFGCLSILIVGPSRFYAVAVSGYVDVKVLSRLNGL